MNRFVNEINADEVNRGNGIKVGDFGVGGRSYRYISTGSRYRNAGNIVIEIILGIVACIALYFTEREYYNISGAIPEAKNAYSYGFNPEVVDYHNGKIVHAMSPPGKYPIREGQAPSDKYFNMFIEDDKVVHLRRVTEYCQWQEIEHRDRRVIGRNPDYCTSLSGNQGDRCASVSCSSYSSQGSCTGTACCSWRKGDEIYETIISYTYHKAWRSHQINSLRFDNPAAYHNPSRDPAPSREFSSNNLIDISGGSLGSSALRVRADDAASALTSWQQVYLTKRNTENLTHAALAEGFSEASHLHFYSRVPENGFNNPILKAAASYLIDGVIDVNEISKLSGLESLLGKAGLDWITKGTCNAGDVRVHFETRSIPREISVIGEQQSPNIIIPHRFKNGATLLFSEGQALNVSALCEKIMSDLGWYTWLYRGLTVLLAVILTLVFDTERSKFTLVRGLLIFLIPEALVSLYFYGIVIEVVLLISLSLIGVGLLLSPLASSPETKKVD